MFTCSLEERCYPEIHIEESRGGLLCHDSDDPYTLQEVAERCLGEPWYMDHYGAGTRYESGCWTVPKDKDDTMKRWLRVKRFAPYEGEGILEDRERYRNPIINWVTDWFERTESERQAILTKREKGMER